MKILILKKTNSRNLLKRIDKFKTFLMEHPEFETEILSIGDGLSVSRKKE